VKQEDHNHISLFTSVNGLDLNPSCPTRGFRLSIKQIMICTGRHSSSIRSTTCIHTCTRRRFQIPFVLSQPIPASPTSSQPSLSPAATAIIQVPMKGKRKASTDLGPDNNVRHRPDTLGTPAGLGVSLAGAKVAITDSSFYQSQGPQNIHNGDVHKHETVIQNNTGSFVPWLVQGTDNGLTGDQQASLGYVLCLSSPMQQRMTRQNDSPLHVATPALVQIFCKLSINGLIKRDLRRSYGFTDPPAPVNLRLRRQLRRSVPRLAFSVAASFSSGPTPVGTPPSIYSLH
jgi:hypothetical protein